MRQDYLPFGKPNFSDAEVDAVSKVMRSGWIGMGPETVAFEEELSAFMKAPFVVTVNSCTSALFLSLKVVGIRPGDEVIVPSLTWCATANAALYLGATPIFCDIDPETFCMTAESIKAQITSRTKAVIVVHYGGYAVDVKALRKELPESIAIVEDAAHALGSKYPDGTMVGSSGNMTCFSFYANKNLSTGEGGAISLFNNDTADKLKSLRQNAMPADAWKRFSHPHKMLYSILDELGYKMNYTDLQACIGRIQLKRQPEFSKIRADIVDSYMKNLSFLDGKIQFQKNIDSPFHSKHLFPILLECSNMSRDELVLKLRAVNIGASIHYPPLHRMPLYKSSGHLDVTERISDRIMTLPISASIMLSDAEYITNTIKGLNI